MQRSSTRVHLRLIIIGLLLLIAVPVLAQQNSSYSQRRLVPASTIVAADAGYSLRGSLGQASPSDGAIALSGGDYQMYSTAGQNMPMAAPPASDQDLEVYLPYIQR